MFTKNQKLYLEELVKNRWSSPGPGDSSGLSTCMFCSDTAYHCKCDTITVEEFYETKLLKMWPTQMKDRFIKKFEEKATIRKALVVVDMSNDFVDDNGSLTAGKPAQKIVPYILEVAQEFHDNGDCVVIAMDAHKENDPHFELWPPHNVVGTWGQELYGELKPWVEEHRGNYTKNSDVAVFGKSNYNAFHDTRLAEFLRDKNVEEVHVVGVCTDICVYLTLAGADANGFKTVVHKQGCATFTENGNLFIEQAKMIFHTKIVD